MMRLCNYISYCIYSFIPLYLFLIGYYIYIDKIIKMILVLILTMIALVLLLFNSMLKVNNIFVCSYKEVKSVKILDFNYFLFVILFFCLWFIEFHIFILFLVLLAIFCILYRLNFIFLSYMLLILNYKCYNIRDKIVYSKKNKKDLIILLKKQNYLQIKEISHSIYIEDECYSIKRDFCLK